jgi:hypothetical protein
VSTQTPKTTKRQSSKAGRTQHGQPQVIQVGATKPKKPGRKPGKHSNENYTQTSIYLPIELRNRVRAKLYEKGMEMSGLLEDMLRSWLEGQK